MDKRSVAKVTFSSEGAILKYWNGDTEMVSNQEGMKTINEINDGKHQMDLPFDYGDTAMTLIAIIVVAIPWLAGVGYIFGGT